MQWNGLKSDLVDYFCAHDGVTYVVCPFIRPSLLAEIIPKDQQVIVITSWRKDHLLTRVSSLDLYPFCKENSWKLFINGRLHLKLYSRDLDSAWIGSANLTGAALGDGPRDNHEILHHIAELEPEDRRAIRRIQAESNLVNDAVYEQYQEWLGRQQPPEMPEHQELDLEPTEEGFLTSHIPHSDDPGRVWDFANGEEPTEYWEIPAMEHDLASYPVSTDLPRDEFIAQVKPTFFQQPLIKKFAEEVDAEGIGFGQIKRWVQENCTDVPVPHARELTFVIQGLMRWFVDLDPDTYEVIRPVHREVLRRKSIPPLLVR